MAVEDIQPDPKVMAAAESVRENMLGAQFDGGVSEIVGFLKALPEFLDVVQDSLRDAADSIERAGTDQGGPVLADIAERVRDARSAVDVAHGGAEEARDEIVKRAAWWLG
jgi:hypothetical protein